MPARQLISRVGPIEIFTRPAILYFFNFEPAVSKF